MGFKIVVSGADSDLAAIFFERCEALPWIFSYLGKDFDAESAESAKSYLQYVQPNIFINLATDFLDRRQREIDPIAHLVSACQYTNTPVVQLASYETIDALSTIDNRDEVVIDELGVSEQKHIDGDHARLERLLCEVDNHILLRCSWVLDGGRNALLPCLVPELLAGTNRAVSDHCFGYPVSISFLSDLLIALIKQVLTGSVNWGTYHVRSSDRCSEAEFCDHLVRQLQKEMGVELAFPSVANQSDDRRFFSGNAQLGGRALTDDFGIQQPTWRRGFTRLLREWLLQNGYCAETEKNSESTAL